MATFRKRSTNFTASEKKLLINLVKEKRSILEDKRNDASALKKKEETWYELCLKYNSRQGVNKRSVGQLQRCWKNMKARSKEAVDMEMEDKGETKYEYELPQETRESEYMPNSYDHDLDVYPSDGETSGNTIEEMTPSPTADMHSYSSDSSGIAYNMPYSAPSNGRRKEENSLSVTRILNNSTPAMESRNGNVSSNERECLKRVEHRTKMKLLQMKMDIVEAEHNAVMKVYGAQLHYWQLRTQQLLGSPQDT